MIKPWQVSDAGLAFGTLGKDLPTEQECYRMQDAGEIKREYVGLVGDWFFKGLAAFNPTPREGIDVKQAMRCIRGELTSWERSHQHKELLVAWLLDQWFESIEWKVKEKE